MIQKGDKSGQFYLAAAVIIILLVVGFAGVTNYLKQDEPVRIYDLRDELGIEGSQVLDHGVYNERSTQEMNDLLRDFTQNYSVFVERGFSLYFVFGNKEELVVAGFRDLITGQISVEYGGGSSTLQITKGVYNATTFVPEPGEEEITVVIEDNTYDFELQEGENFYFVIFERTEGGTFVEQG